MIIQKIRETVTSLCSKDFFHILRALNFDADARENHACSVIESEHEINAEKLMCPIH